MPDYAPKMNRSVSQLLFNYLPGRTVDWENGVGIVAVDSPRIGEVWPQSRAALVLAEVAAYRRRWADRGGDVGRFPDPDTRAIVFATATPEAVNAKVFVTALHCYECSQFTFERRGGLARHGSSRPLVCPNCGKRTLRQFGLVFVHGCGHMAAITDRIPFVASDGRTGFRPIRCESCPGSPDLQLISRTDSASSMSIVCRHCRRTVVDRFTASCHECARQELRHIAPGAEPDASFRPRTAMRITRHSASDAFFVHSLTVLRLTRAPVLAEPTPEMLELQRLLPPAERAMTPTDPTESLTGLTDQLRRAQERHDGPEIQAILQRIELVATRARNGSPLGPMEDVAEETDPAILWNAPDDVIKGVKESQALLETVHLRSARGVGESGGGPSAENLDEFDQLMAALGLSRLDVVADLPIVTASFGFTRRSVDPEHEEFQQRIATSLRPFPVLDDRASLTSGRHDLPGKHPILAREGEHEGLLLTLDLPRVVRWLALNGVDISQEQPARAAILAALEDVNRYYDNIWELPVRRLVFGLVHSLSHAAMRAASYFAGIDRTSISEYLFLPLLGTVVYSNATTFSLGGMEALARDHLSSFLVKLRSEAVSCLYDPDCLDRKSACHGCIHSPDISCRVFNHGLARSFLLGGRAPWASDAARVIGYWEI